VILGRWGASAAVLALLLAAGCGRRGPPLQPFVRIPDAVEQLSVRRAGDEAFVTLTVPQRNVDGSVPVAIDHILVYGYTGVTAPPGGRWGEFASVVATVPVMGPAPGVETMEGPDGAAPPEGPPPPIELTGPILPGQVIVIRDVLTDDERVQGPLPGNATAAPPAEGAPARVLQRHYAAFAFDTRGRPGPPGQTVQLPLADVPPAPEVLSATWTQDTLTLSWTPSGGLLGYLFEQRLAPEALPRGIRAPGRGGGAAPAAPAPTRYNVYRVLPGDTPAPPSDEPWRAAPPMPAHTAPAPGLSFSEPVQFGVERCFVVRATRGTGAQAVESAPSPRLCPEPMDVFPPAAPAGLTAFPGPGRIDLVWTPNTEADLGGYLVFRGLAGELALQPLTPMPVREARFLDENIETGVRYQYAVVAVDSRAPEPNRSAESARVAAAAR